MPKKDIAVQYNIQQQQTIVWLHFCSCEPFLFWVWYTRMFNLCALCFLYCDNFDGLYVIVGGASVKLSFVLWCEYLTHLAIDLWPLTLYVTDLVSVVTGHKIMQRSSRRHWLWLTLMWIMWRILREQTTGETGELTSMHWIYFQFDFVQCRLPPSFKSHSLMIHWSARVVRCM